MALARGTMARYGEVDGEAATVAIAIALPLAICISFAILTLARFCSPKRQAMPIFHTLPEVRNPPPTSEQTSQERI